MTRTIAVLSLLVLAAAAIVAYGLGMRWSPGVFAAALLFAFWIACVIGSLVHRARGGR